MKFLLIGCNGKMGKTIYSTAQEYGDDISCGIDISIEEATFTTFTSTKNITEDFDAIIDFSTTSNHTNYIQLAINKKVPYGLFSTMLDNQTLNNLKTAAEIIPIIHCKNTSVGVNFLFELVSICAKQLQECDCAITEYHHKFKQDKPSGTASEIEKILINKNIQFLTSSFRVGNEKGTHKIEFFLNDEKISIEHVAYSRNIFAHGAIKLMHKLIKKEKGYFNYL